MKISISGNRKVADLQKEFNSFFPFLNLEFFDLSQDQMSNYISPGRSFPQFTLDDLREEKKDGEMLISQQMTVMQFENLLADQFGLKAEVFVRSENKWMRSSLNGYWTLFHKNEVGRMKALTYHSSF